LECGYGLFKCGDGRAGVAGIGVAGLVVTQDAVELVDRVVPVTRRGHDWWCGWMSAIDRGRRASVDGEGVEAHGRLSVPAYTARCSVLAENDLGVELEADGPGDETRAAVVAIVDVRGQTTLV